MTDIHFIEYDADQLWREMLRSFAEEAGDVLYPGDARELVLRMLLFYQAQTYARVDDAARQTLLRYARGQILDEMGELVDVVRLEARPAVVTLRFTLAALQTQAVFVPMGTRATNGGNLFFQTLEPLSIEPGALYGDVLAACTVEGLAGNGLSAGLIDEIVDPVRFVLGVSNTDTSRDGADIEADDALRERIRIAPGKFSTAGPYDAYRYWAFSAHPAISDVGVRMRVPGVVELTVLLSGGTATTQTILDLVFASCNDWTRRPLTDMVEVRAPEIVPLSMGVHYVAPMGLEAEVVEAVEGAGGALEAYRAWQRERLGRAVNPDRLRMLLMQAGCIRVMLTGATYMALESYQVAVVEEMAVTHEAVKVDG